VSARPTVVIADDESIIRLDLKEMLEAAEFDVVGEAARGDEAVDLIRRLSPQLALLDIKMPVLDGIEVAQRVRDTDTIVVLLTAFSQRDLIESARDAGVTSYLVKPFRKDEIIPKLTAVLRHEDPADAAEDTRSVDDKIQTRDIVERAKALLMEERGINEQAAFDLIQQTAMRSRSRMRDIAHRVLQGEELD
jgi:two-component system, response regulator PdtaR